MIGRQLRGKRIGEKKGGKINTIWGRRGEWEGEQTQRKKHRRVGERREEKKEIQEKKQEKKERLKKKRGEKEEWERGEVA